MSYNKNVVVLPPFLHGYVWIECKAHRNVCLVFSYKEKSRTLLYDFSPQKNQDSNMKLKNGQNHPVTFMIIPHLVCKCKRISDRFLTVFSEFFILPMQL